MKNFNSPMDAGLDTGVLEAGQPVPGRDRKIRFKGQSSKASVAEFGRMDARATTSIGNCANWISGGTQSEGDEFKVYSETAQEIKMRKAAEKRARRSGKQS